MAKCFVLVWTYTMYYTMVQILPFVKINSSLYHCKGTIVAFNAHPQQITIMTVVGFVRQHNSMLNLDHLPHEDWQKYIS